MLQILVDRQLERRARGRRPLDAAERAAAGIALDEHRAGAAEDQRVVGGLDTGQADVVHADIAEHVRRQIRVRVGALALLDETDARQVERRHARRLIRPHLPADVGEVPALANPLDHRLAILGVAVGQRAAQRRGRRLGVAELARHRVDRVGVHAVGEDVPVAIEDVAALGGRLDGARMLALGARLQLAVAEDLQIDQARLDGDRPEQEKAEAPGRPGASALRARRWRAGRATRKLRSVLASSDDGPRRGRGLDDSLDHDRIVSRRAPPSAAVRWPSARFAPASAASRSRDAGAG